jgi:hypothetical protein
MTTIESGINYCRNPDNFNVGKVSASVGNSPKINELNTLSFILLFMIYWTLLMMSCDNKLFWSIIYWLYIIIINYIYLETENIVCITNNFTFFIEENLMCYDPDIPDRTPIESTKEMSIVDTNKYMMIIGCIIVIISVILMCCNLIYTWLHNNNVLEKEKEKEERIICNSI